VPVQCWLSSLDRWQTQAAERVVLELGPGNTLVLQQQVCMQLMRAVRAPARCGASVTWIQCCACSRGP